MLDSLVLEPGAFYLMDRGYLDFARLFVIHEAQAFFVTRAKSNTKFKRRYSHPVDRVGTPVLCDQTGVLTTYQSSKDYPTTMRRVASDGRAQGKPVFQGFSLSLSVPDDAEALRLFSLLSEGGQVQMPLAKTFYASSFGMVADRFGVPWMVIVVPLKGDEA